MKQDIEKILEKNMLRVLKEVEKAGEPDPAAPVRALQLHLLMKWEKLFRTALATNLLLIVKPIHCHCS